MTRMNLSEAMLLQASGELSPATRTKLEDYMARHPESRHQLEQIKGQFELLRSIPKAEMSEDLRRKMAASIKHGVQKKLRQREWEETSRKRWALIYRSLAGVSAAAAAIIVVAGVLVINQANAQKREQERIATVRAAADDIASLDRPSEVDDVLQGVKDSIQQYQDRSSAQALQDHDMSNLMSVLANLNTDKDEIMPPPEPGAL